MIRTRRKEERRLWWCVIISFTQLEFSDEVRVETCNGDVFEIGCPTSHVIVMDQALYGRMRTGSCVETDFGFVGCSADVLATMDERCSGRHTCSVLVVDQQLLEGRRPCNSEFKLFLESDYHCVPVISTHGKTCDVATSAQSMKIRRPSGYISSAVTEKTGCGSKIAPWLIEADAGQRINVTLLDFSVSSVTSRDRGRPHFDNQCLLYATIKESGSRGTSTVNVCGGVNRERYVFTSLGESIEITLESQQRRGASSAGGDLEFGHFLLKYEAFDCADPSLPEGFTYVRSGSAAIVGCGPRDMRWQIICRGSEWIGTIGNCSNDKVPPSAESQNNFVRTLFALPINMAVVVTFSVALAVALCILVCGLFIFKRRYDRDARRIQENIRHQRQRGLQTQTGEQQVSSEYVDKYATVRVAGLTTLVMDKRLSSTASSTNENEYSYVYDPLLLSTTQGNSAIRECRGDVISTGQVPPPPPFIPTSASERSVRKIYERSLSVADRRRPYVHVYGGGGGSVRTSPNYFELDPGAAVAVRQDSISPVVVV